MNNFNTIEEAIEDIKKGKMLVVVDDENRENEGDLVIAAEKITGEAINFMAKNARGLVCMPMKKKRLKELCIDQMVSENTDSHKTAFTVSIDAVSTTTGISAYERADTVRKVLDPKAKAQDFKRPGHIFPLEAKEAGVLERMGHTEASVDLAELAGLYPASVICEIMNEDGTMARVPQLMDFVKKHDLKIITIADLIEYRLKNESVVEKISEAILPTAHGEFLMHGYINKLNGEHHVALSKGNIDPSNPILIRVHSECLTGDAFHSLRCDCGQQLQEAMERIQEAGQGILLYMRQEGRGIGLLNKIKAYSLQDQGMDTVEANLALGFPADLRDYSISAQILKDLGVKKAKLMTNNPRKIEGLKKYGIDVCNREPIQMNPNEKNKYYLKTKKEKLDHMLSFEG